MPPPQPKDSIAGNAERGKIKKRKGGRAARVEAMEGYWREESLTRLWIVRVSDIGSERRTNLYFRTAEEAHRYADSRDRADEPIHKDFPNDKVCQLLESTEFYLDPERY